MSQFRVSKNYYFKAFNIPINTFKDVFFFRLKNKFKSILITQSIEENNDGNLCTHNIAIQMESRVI